MNFFFPPPAESLQALGILVVAYIIIKVFEVLDALITEKVEQW